jgi:hypothetical protein
VDWIGLVAMTSRVIDLGLASLKSKRLYSKGGCRECKRRKIKCDEAKPQCWQCVRLRKQCSYPALGEKVLRVSKKRIENQFQNQYKPQNNEIIHNQTIDENPESIHNETIHENPESIHNQTIHENSQIIHNQTIHQNPELSNHIPNIGNNRLNQNLNGNHPHISYTNFHVNVPNVANITNNDSIRSQTQNQNISIPIPNTIHNNLSNQTPIFNATPVSNSIPMSNHIPIPSTVPISGTMPISNSMPVPNTLPISNQTLDYLPHLRTHTLPPPTAILHTYLSASYLPQPSYPLHSIMSIPRHFVQNPSIDNLLNENDTSVPSCSPIKSSQPAVSPINKTGPSPIASTTPPIDDSMLQFFDQHDLNVLATDLNNIVNSIMFESNFGKNKNIDISSENSSVSLGLSPLTSSSPLSVSSYQPREYSGSISSNFIKLSTPHEKMYLEAFYEHFASIILPFNSWDSNNNKYFNPARDVILRVAAHEPYLLAAILAHGAKALFRNKKLPNDEQAYCLYLSKCLEMLGPALTNDDTKKSNDNLTSNVEAVLLTVLILTAANASNALQNWRPHLQGAKDLLLKNSNHKNRCSKIVIFCKCWFVCLEILAGISSQLGGTLNSDEELDLLFSSDDYEISVLKDFGIILENGFSIMLGYHYKCVEQFRDLIKLLNKKRLFKNQHPNKKYVPENSFAYLKLLSELYYQSEIEFINKKCILSPMDFPNEVVPKGDLIDYIPGIETVVSWQDTSHQAYVTAAIITVLTEFFLEPYTSVQVQFLTSRIVSLIEFLRKESNVYRHLMSCSLIMLLWPMYVAGLNCINEESKVSLKKYFHNSAHMGSGGANFALKRINKVWKKHGNGPIETDDDDEDGNVDLVSY